MHLKKGAQVKIISGKDKGKTGEILEINRKLNRVKIKAINMMKKHTKPNPQLGETGGIVEKEAAINLSNVAIWNPKLKKADRVSFLVDGEKKLRVYSSDKKEIKS